MVTTAFRVVALPDAMMASPLFVIHAFYQLLLGAVVVFLAALWRHGGRTALGYAVAGGSVGGGLAYLVGPFITRVIAYAAGAPLDDPQGAIAFLPTFQIGLYAAVWLAAFVNYRAAGWRQFAAGFAVLGLSQAAGLLALRVFTIHSALMAHVRDVRGWAVAGPLLIIAAVVNVRRPRR